MAPLLALSADPWHESIPGISHRQSNQTFCEQIRKTLTAPRFTICRLIKTLHCDWSCLVGGSIQSIVDIFSEWCRLPVGRSPRNDFDWQILLRSQCPRAASSFRRAVAWLAESVRAQHIRAGHARYSCETGLRNAVDSSARV